MSFSQPNKSLIIIVHYLPRKNAITFSDAKVKLFPKAFLKDTVQVTALTLELHDFKQHCWNWRTIIR